MKTILTLLCAGILCTVQAETTDESYRKIVLSIRDADDLKEKGDSSAAFAKYQDAYKALEQFRKDHPTWSETLVQYRLEDLASKLAAKSHASSAAGDRSDTAANPPKELNVLSRAGWHAKPPVSEMKPHTLHLITIHHTGMKQKPELTVEKKLQALQKFSQNTGTLASGDKKAAWPDVPYHFYITCHGEIAEGREIGFVGDTNTEYDPTGHILVTLEGNFQSEEVTEAQMKAARQLVRWLAQEYKVPVDKIGGHKDFAKTSCPGEHLYSRLRELQEVLP